MGRKVITENLLAPLGSAKSAKVEIDTPTGHLAVDCLAAGEQMLASGTLQYLENQDSPIQSVTADDGRATLTLRGTPMARSWFRLPWEACLAVTEWLIHLNPAVPSDIAAHTGAGNIRLNLAGMSLTRLVADSAGGNLDLVLPDTAANLSVAARTGGGNVTVEFGDRTAGRNALEAGSGAGNIAVRVPGGMAARVRATSGLGKVIVDPRFGKLDASTYQSPDYESAANRIEITAKSGAGNVTVSTR